MWITKKNRLSLDMPVAGGVTIYTTGVTEPAQGALYIT